MKASKIENNESDSTSQGQSHQIPQIQPIPEKKIFKDAGLSLAQIAHGLHLSYAYTSKILNGIAPITSKTRMRLNMLLETLEKR